MNNLGIMSGRLTAPRGRGYQFFPLDNWRQEFEIAKNLGIKAIELVVDEQSLAAHPLLSDKGIAELLAVIHSTGVAVRHVIAHIFVQQEFKDAALLKNLIMAAKRIGAESIELPLLEKSAVSTEADAQRLVASLKPVLETLSEQNINLALESDLPAAKLTKLIKRLDHKNITAVFDAGNSAAAGFDPEQELTALGSLISNIHIKDRKTGGGTVALGTGAVDFKKIFAVLAAIRYSGDLTLEAARGEDGQELQNVRAHLAFLKKRKIWIIINHPWQLLLALAIKRASDHKELEFHLIVDSHKYWKDLTPGYEREFKSVTFFKQLPRAHGFKDAMRFIRQARLLKKQARALPVQSGDVFLVLSDHRYVENIVTSIFSKNRTVFLCRYDQYQDLKQTLREVLAVNNAFVTKSGYLHYLLLDPLLQLKKRTLQYWIRGEKLHGMALSRPVNELYDHVFILRSLHATSLAKDEIYYPYCFLPANQTAPAAGKKKMIVFLLSAYKRYFNAEQYEQFSQILLSLAKQYSGQYEMVLRLHPSGLDEYVRLNTNGWVINNDPGNGEQFLLNNSANIAACLSIASLPLFFSFNLGIPSYGYHLAVGLSADMKNKFDRQFAEMPDSFFIKSPEAILPAESLRLAAPAIVQKSLEKLFQVLLKD